jgi:hypothetical protein
MKTYELPKAAKKIIQEYFELKLNGKTIPCPYYINTSRKKDLRAMVGKGTPEEIIMEAKIWEKLKGVNFSKMTEEEIREFLRERGIGIDCSGFVLHVLNEWHKDKKKRPIWGKLTPSNKSFIHRLAYILKPVQRLGAEIITNDENSIPVSINEVMPGDVIRSKWKKKNSHHILLISKVTKDEGGNTKEIEYVNASEQYGKNDGVRYGKIVIKDPNQPLQNQGWIDPDTDGTNHTYEGFLVNIEDNGLRRIKAMEELVDKS